MGVDLSLKDIRFLRAIRDINNDPEEYPETDRGEVPANKAAIREVTDLNADAIEYRLGGSDKRGFGQDGMGLINVHSATIEENMFGPKSAELTSKGLEELSKVEDEGVLGDGESTENEAIKQLRARLDEIENTEFSGESDVTAGELASMVEQVRTQIDELESQINKKYNTLEQRIEGIESGESMTEWGNVSEEKAEDLDRVLRMAPAIAFAWSEVLGISLQEIINADEVTDDMINSYQEVAAQSLGASDGNDPSIPNPETNDVPDIDGANTDGGEINASDPEVDAAEQVTLDEGEDIVEDGGEATDDTQPNPDTPGSE